MISSATIWEWRRRSCDWTGGIELSGSRPPRVLGSRTGKFLQGKLGEVDTEEEEIMI